MRLSEVRQEQIPWVWPGRIARGMFTLLEGDPGIGKGFVLVDLLARITRGWPMPDEETPENRGKEVRPPENVVLCTSEESRAHVLKPRAVAAGADQDRFYCLSGPLQMGRSPAVLAEAFTRVVQAEVGESGAAIVVMDPFDDVIPGIAVADASTARTVVTTITEFAARTRIAPLAVRHLNKKRSSAIQRGSGTIALSAVARTVFTIAQDPEEISRIILACVKDNLAAHPPSLAFRIVSATVEGPEDQPIDAGRVEWLGESRLCAEDLQRSPVRQREAAVAGRAELFLLELLGDGPVPIQSILDQASEASLSEASIWRAKAALDVESTRKGFGAGATWLWRLPDS